MPTLVLHHGLFGYGHVRVGPVQTSSFNGIDRALSSPDLPVLLTHVHPTASVDRRAAQLKRNILSHLHENRRPDDKVILLAHSMGGLDARHMISHLGMSDRVAALVTISTPHHGSPYADWCLRNLTRTGVLRVFTYLGLDISAVKDLTTDAAQKFNNTTPDAPGVQYFSVSAARPWHQICPLLLPSHRIVHKSQGDNDGLVSVQSATHGTHLSTWPADHWHVINKRFTLERHPTDIRKLYHSLLDTLRTQNLLPAEPAV